MNKHSRDTKKKSLISRHVLPYLCRVSRGHKRTRYPEWVRGTSEDTDRGGIAQQSQLLQGKTSQRQLLTCGFGLGLEHGLGKRMGMVSSMETKEDQKQINIQQKLELLASRLAPPNGTMSGPGVEPGFRGKCILSFYTYTL